MIAIPAEVVTELQVLAGNPQRFSNRPLEVWHSTSVEFLVALGKRLMKPAIEQQLPDVVTLAYWLRAGNLQRLRPAIVTRLQVGVGLVLHICPANVPVNFAFSMAFALLAGNSSILRLPSKDSPATALIVQAVQQLLEQPEFAAMQQRLLLVRYGHDNQITAALMKQADARVIWGGDATVQHMRQFATPVRSREIAFADRYSLALLCPQAVLTLDDKRLDALAQRLFNDVMLLDQAACSSPQLFVWLGADSAAVQQAQARLWPALARVSAAKQVWTPIGQMNKWVDACDAVLAHEQIVQVRSELGEAGPGLLTRIELQALLAQPEQLRGYFGTAIEIQLDTLEPLAAVVNERYQTLCYFGIEPTQLREWLLRHQLRGIDRIVPVGQAIDMGLYWDGYDLLSSLSRGIEIR